MAGSVEFRTPQDVLELLALAANEELKLDNSSGRNRVLATIAEKALRALEVVDFEARISALEVVLDFDESVA